MSAAHAAENRIRGFDVTLRIPTWRLRVGPWQYGDDHGWRVSASCERCKSWAGNSPGPTLLLALIAFRDFARGHRRSCRPRTGGASDA